MELRLPAVPGRPDGAPAGDRVAARCAVALGVAWLADAALQLQPANLGRGLATSVVDEAMGEPGPVQHLELAVAAAVGAHPLAVGLSVAGVQTALGVALLARRTRRSALAASVPWALTIWGVGEAFGGVASGFAMVPTGAPGAALLYGVVAVVLLASDRPRAAATAWTACWGAGALLQVVPVGSLGFKLAAGFDTSALEGPHFLATWDRAIGAFALVHGPAVTAALAGLELAVAAAPAAGPRLRAVLLGLGLAACLAFWLAGEDLGGLLSGASEDVGAMPLYALLAAALGTSRSRPAERRGTMAATAVPDRGAAPTGPRSGPAWPSRREGAVR